MDEGLCRTMRFSAATWRQSCTKPHGTGVSYLFDDTITALQQDMNGVLVNFEKAAPRRFDLVVGADGLHSVTRRLAFGAEPEALQPLGLLNAWFTVPAEIELDDWYLMYNAPGGA